MMNCADTCLLDLPNEILLKILKKLNNMDVLYSLIGIGVKRLDNLVQNEIFTNTLNFVSTDSTFDRFCIDILPRIRYNVQYLVVEPVNMPRILFACDYPALTKFKIFNFTENIVSRYITGNPTEILIEMKNIEFVFR
jgi:hypothetical protein